jgi:hypothetical protein
MLRVRKRHVHAVGQRSHRRPALRLFRRAGASEAHGIVDTRAGDSGDHLALQLADGTRSRDCHLPQTLWGYRTRRSRLIPGRAVAALPRRSVLRDDGRLVAERMLAAASEAVCEVVYKLVTSQKLRNP